MNSQDRYRILSNIVSQKGTDNVDLYAELAKAESMVNLMDTQKAMAVQQPMQPQEPTTPPEVTPM
jgi:hypothetical protein